MTERLLSQDTTAQDQVSQLVAEISGLNHIISDIYALRDVLPGRFLPQEEFDRIRELHHVTDQKTIDLLLIRSGNPDEKIQVVLQKFKREEIHPFSMNKVSIYVPSVEDPNRDYLIRTELSDLRRPGLLEDSLDAKRLLGDVTESNETPVGYVHRTVSELMRIRNLTRGIVAGETSSEYSADELNVLSLKLITERLWDLKANGQLPLDSSLSFFLIKDYTGQVLGENTQFSLNGRSFDFPTSGQRLKGFIGEIGGYDRVITLNP